MLQLCILLRPISNSVCGFFCCFTTKQNLCFKEEYILPIFQTFLHITWNSNYTNIPLKTRILAKLYIWNWKLKSCIVCLNSRKHKSINLLKECRPLQKLRNINIENNHFLSIMLPKNFHLHQIDSISVYVFRHYFLKNWTFSPRGT